jgi:PEP-CTERM motif
MKLKFLSAPLALLALAAIGFLCPTASADEIASITTTTCGSSTCPLATYTAIVTSTGTNTDTVSLEIKIDPTATIISGTDNYIQSVDVKFDSSLSAATLDAAHSLNIGSGWSTAPNVSLNNSNCSGSGSGFICSQDSGSGLAVVQGGDYKWVWDVTTATGSNLTDTIHIGANYNPAMGYIVSQEVATPEPGTVALLGLGLLGLIALRKRALA